MFANLNVPATVVFVAFFVAVTVLGFYAARWRSGDLDTLHEWGLGGRRFGAWVTWFLLGGDLYTAYTVIAVPALVYGSGATGFYAVAYTILIYPLLFVALPRLWNVTQRHGYVTAADFVAGRYGDRYLALAVAFTGILATMPYIALQLVGMERVIQALGFPGQGWQADLPLGIAFVILALYTYTSGLRAPAMIAVVKDVMIYIFVIAGVILIPIKLGGYGAIFQAAGASFDAANAAAAAAHKPPVGGLVLGAAGVWPFITLAIGSALALFMYPHSMTGILAATGPRTIRRNAVSLPAYSLVLGLIALMGLMARAAHLPVTNPQDAVPQLFLAMFPAWFAGFTFAAIAIGALVPAAVMSIGAANTFVRNIYVPFVRPDATPDQESTLAKLVSLVVKVGALVVIVLLPTQFAINLQLLGGAWMIQVLPAILLGLYTRRFSGPALLLGWVVGMVSATALMLGSTVVSTVAIPGLGVSVYVGLATLVLNVAVAAILSAVLPNRAEDATLRGDFEDGPELPVLPARV